MGPGYAKIAYVRESNLSLVEEACVARPSAVRAVSGCLAQGRARAVVC